MNITLKQLLLALSCFAIVAGLPACGRCCKKRCNRDESYEEEGGRKSRKNRRMASEEYNESEYEYEEGKEY